MHKSKYLAPYMFEFTKNHTHAFTSAVIYDTIKPTVKLHY